MGPTFSGLVAASLLLGQTGDMRVIGPVPTSGGAYSGPGGVQQQLVVTTPDAGAPAPRRGLFGWREDRPILSRMQSWFGRRDSATPVGADLPASGTVIVAPGPATPTGTVTDAPVTPSGDYHRRMPSTGRFGTPAGAVVGEEVIATPAEVNPVTYEKAPGQAKSPLLPGVVQKVGRDEKFAWITGQLEIENGVYVLYYATPETVDPHNGRLPLQTQADMRQFRRGDLVSAAGSVQTRSGLFGNGGAIYRAETVNLVERGAR